MITAAPFTTRRRRLRAGLVAAVAFVLVAAAAAAAPAARAQNGGPGGQKSRSAAARREALAQADGITNRVVDTLWKDADRFWHDGDYYRVVALNRVIVEADPQFVDAYQNAAYLLWSLGDAPGADAFLRLGVSRNPARYELYTEMGQHLFRTRRFSDALPYLKKGAAYKNAPAPAWAVLAHCYERVGRLNDALTTWQQVVKRFPSFPAGPSNLRRVEARKQNDAGAGRPG